VLKVQEIGEHQRPGAKGGRNRRAPAARCERRKQKERTRGQVLEEEEIREHQRPGAKGGNNRREPEARCERRKQYERTRGQVPEEEEYDSTRGQLQED
jgi:hypothetical protein